MAQIRKIMTNFNSISIPEYLLYKSNIRAFDLIFEWIKYRKNEPIPEELKYPGWQTDKKNWESPLMYWIEFRINEPIPDDIYYINCLTDTNICHMNPLMLWIIYRNNDSNRTELPKSSHHIPEELKYPGWQTYRDYYERLTPLMFWIQCKYTGPIPDELKYLGWQTDRNIDGMTPLKLWIQYRENETISEELKYSGWETDINSIRGEFVDMIYY